MSMLKKTPGEKLKICTLRAWIRVRYVPSNNHDMDSARVKDKLYSII